jgi:nucleotide-binding universal stress UspA family protein
MIKINVATDFSETSENAVEFANSYADGLNGKLNVIHAFHPSAANKNIQDTYSRIIQNEKEKLKKYINGLSEKYIQKGHNVKKMNGQIIEGLAVDVLKNLSDKSPDDIIIMGSSNRNPNEKKWLGSVSLKMIEVCKCPLLLIPSKGKYNGFKKVLVCTKDLKLDLSVSRNISNLIPGQNSEIHLVHIGLDDNYNHKIILDKWKELRPDSTVKFNTIIHKVDTKVIEDYCTQYDIDLIVVARDEKNFIQEFLNSSFSKSIALQSTLPVLVMK